MTAFTFSDNLGDCPLHLHVGPEKKHFMVHKKLLTTQSKYFAEKFQTAADGNTLTDLNLEEEDPAAFSLLVEFLYRGTISECVQKQVEGPTISEPLGKAKSTDLSALIPSFEDGTRVFFTTYIEKEPNSTTNQQNVFQNICFMQKFQGFSPEELRLSDYIAGRQVNSAVATETISNSMSNQQATSSLFGNLQNTDIRQPSGSSAPPSATSGGGLFGLGPTRAFGASGGLFGNMLSTVPSSGMPGGGLLPSTGNSLFGNLGSPAPSSCTPLFGGATSAFGGNSNHVSNNTSNSSSLFSSLRRAPFAFGTPIHRSPGMPSGLFSGLRQASNNINALSSSFSGLGGAPFASGSAPDIRAPASTVIPPKFGNSIDQSFPINTRTNTTASQPTSIPDQDLLPTAQAISSLTLLNLCILAEKVSWPALFNTAIKAYISSLITTSFFQICNYVIPKPHVESIYQRTKAGSPLRLVVVDCISRSGSPTEFLDFAQQNREFLADMWKNATDVQGENAAVFDCVREGKYDLRPQVEHFQPVTPAPAAVRGALRAGTLEPSEGDGAREGTGAKKEANPDTTTAVLGSTFQGASTLSSIPFGGVASQNTIDAGDESRSVTLVPTDFEGVPPATGTPPLGGIGTRDFRGGTGTATAATDSESE